MSKKTKITLAIVVSILALYTIIFYAIFPQSLTNDDVNQQETEKEPTYMISIDMYNVKLNQIYGLNLEESCYIYVVPNTWLGSNDIEPEEITICAVNDEGLVEIEFLQKCDDGSFKYKITAKQVGNCEVYAQATYYDYTKSDKFYLSIRDYKEYNIEYCYTDDWDYFHVTSCELYQKYGLDEKHSTSFSRQKMLDMGLLPCKDCCG